MDVLSPVVVVNGEARTHTASRAWARLDGSRRTPARVEVWRETPTNVPASVYRLTFGRGGGPPLFAKHSDPYFGSVERSCYEDILPRAGIPGPQYHGSVEDPDGSVWLFVGDVGRLWYSVQDPDHRRLAGHWLGTLHREAARIPTASALPPAGPGRYLDHLRAARDRIRRHFANPGLTERDRDDLRAAMALQDHVESRWETIQRACAGPPSTLVHGDFQPKNIRIRPALSGAEILVMDWETAGWGNPAVDLAPARGADTTIQVDLEAYASEVSPAWPGVDAAAIRRIAVLGFVLRRLAAMDWASVSLRFEDPLCLSYPVTTLASLSRSTTRGLEAAAEWLG